MSASVDPRLAKLPLRSSAPLRIRGESVRRNPSEVEADKLIGRVIGRSLDVAGLTMDEVAFRLKRHASLVCRWMSGAERAPIALLFILGARFQKAFVIELAKETVGVHVQTVVTIGDQERTA